MSNVPDQETALVMGIFATFGLALLVIALVFYIVDVIARFKYLKVRNYPNAWMAIIPILNVYATIEATYGKVDKIKLFGIELPSMCVKLFPIIISVVTSIASRIPTAGNFISSACAILGAAVSIVIYRDVIARLGKEISIGFSVIANIISIIGSIYLISACKGIAPGEYDYMTDTRPLPSQEGITPPAE